MKLDELGKRGRRCSNNPEVQVFRVLKRDMFIFHFLTSALLLFFDKTGRRPREGEGT